MVHRGISWLIKILYAWIICIASQYFMNKNILERIPNGHFSLPKNYVRGSPSSNNYYGIHLESHEHWKQQPPVPFPYIVFFGLGILIYWLVVLNNWNWGPVSHPRIWPPNQGFDHRNQVLPTSDHIQSPGRHRFRPATSRGFTRGRPPRNGWK